MLQKYSPNHELLLSAASSIVIQGLVIAILILGSSLIWISSDEVSPTVDNLIMGGGGGTLGGAGAETARIGLSLQESIPLRAEKDDLPRPIPLADVKDDLANLSPTEIRDDSQPTTEKKQLTHGRGGTGKGGGRGSGVGPGEGSGFGPGNANLRTHRRDRWTLQLRRRDFARHLANIRAALAIPDGKDQFYLFEDLNAQPVEGQRIGLDDLNRRNLMWWTNSDSVAIQGLVKDLGLPFTPSYVAVFIPLELEQQLMQLELEFQGLSEEQIIKQELVTEFQAESIAGEWQVRVMGQQPRSE